MAYIVEQVDRNLAAEIIRRHHASGDLNAPLGKVVDANIVIQTGKGDDFWLVQLLAAHRSLG